MTYLRFLTTFAIASALLGCGSGDQPKANKDLAIREIPLPDVGDVVHNLNCSAKPRRKLSAREICEIAVFKSRCIGLDDCYVSCLSSPEGVLVGGGCPHICTLGLHPGPPFPPAISSCASVSGKSGL
jgi:hypothetical protein